MASQLQTLTKTVAESPTFSMDFTAKLPASVTPSSITSYGYSGADSALTLGTPAILGNTVLNTFSAGTDGVKYRVQVIIVGSDGRTYEGDGYLLVKNP